jgi:hypothetical protein
MTTENKPTPSDLFSQLESGNYSESTEESPSPEASLPDSGTPDAGGNSDNDIDGILNEIAPTQAAQAAKLKVKFNKEDKEFDLSPDNAELIKLVQQGMLASRIQSERDTYKKKAESYKDYEDVKKDASALREALELANKGYAEQAVKALLGDKYEDFRKDAILSTIEYESADPLTQKDMDKRRADREAQLNQMQKDKRIEELERKMNDRDEAVEVDRYHGIGTQLLQKYSMEQYVSDKELAAEMNQELWESTWNTMAKLPDDIEWTPSVIEKVMRKKAALFRGGVQKTAEAKVAQMTETKKAAAKEQAQNYVRRNQGTNTDEFASKLKGTSSPLDKLNILLGRG